MRILKYIIVFLFLATNAFGATYWADPAGLGTTCSEGSPCTIVYTIETKAGSGDTVKLKDGDYPITDDLDVPVGVSIISDSTDNTKVKIYPSSNIGAIPVLNLSSASPGTNGNQTISYIELSGLSGANQYGRVGIKIRNRSNVTIDNCNIHDFKGNTSSSGIDAYSDEVSPPYHWYTYWPTDSQVPGTETNLDAIWPANPIEGLTISNNTITDCGYAPATGLPGVHPSIFIWGLKDSSIHDNVIDATNSNAPPIHGTEAWLENVDIYDNDFTMIKYSGRSSYALEIWCMKGGSEIYDNTSNAAFSILYGKETLVHDNTINAQLSGVGIEFNLQSYGAVYDNYLNSTKYGISAGLDSEHQSRNFNVDHVVIRNNVAYNIERASIVIYARGGGNSYTNTVSNIYIYNDSLDTNTDGAGYGLLRLHQADGVSSYGVMSDIYVKNLILSNSHASEYGGVVVGVVSSSVIDYTLFYNNGTDDIQNFTDTNATIDDPDYVGPLSAYDGFAPDIGSPAIDAGTHLTDINDGDDCVAAGEDCTIMVVDNAGYFRAGDYVWVDTGTDFLELIASIDLATDTITLNAEHDFEDNGDIYLAISTAVGFGGTSIDIGAIEADYTASVLSGLLPTSTPNLACTTDPRNVTLEVTSNEDTTVKYCENGVGGCDSSTDYDTMAGTFSTTGGTSHSKVVSKACSANPTYYVRSEDGFGNQNSSSGTITFTIDAGEPPPITKSHTLSGGGVSGGSM